MTRELRSFLLSGILTAGWLLGQSSSVEAARVSWHTDFRQAAVASRESQKPMLVKISATWCGYCTKMKKSFADEIVVKHLNRCFIPVSVDADENQKLVQAIGIKGLPTTVIISPEMKIVEKITGFRTARQLDKYLVKICKATPETPAFPVSARSRESATRRIAFGQYCLVSLLKDRKLLEGSEKFTSTHGGKTIFFASAEYKQLFDRNPSKYWPALDGLCPVSLAEKKKPLEGDPRIGAVYQDQLWLFADRKQRDKFADEPKRYADPDEF